MKKKFYAILIVLAVFAVHAPATRNDFVWDDTALVLRDPLIRSWRLIPEGFNHFLFTDATPSDFYRPIQRLTYTLEYIAVGFRPAAYHFTSIACHGAAAVALFLFAEELLIFFGAAAGSRRFVAFAATLVWAIHPVHSAAIDYVAGRADPLAVAFGCLGLFFGLRIARTPGKQGWLLFFASAACLLLSALSKEAGLIFPLLWIVILIIGKTWKPFPKALGTAIFVVLAYASLRLPAEHFPPPTLHTPPPLLVRPVIMARAVAEYAGLIAFPLRLHMERDVESRPIASDVVSATDAAWRELQTLLGIVLIAAVLYWAWRAFKSNKAVFACIILAVVSYLPISGIIALNATVAEHWIYLPSAFLLLAAALAIAELSSRPAYSAAWLKPAIAVICVFWITFLGTRSFIRTFDWTNQRTFLERTVASGGNSARMLINLGSMDFSEGRIDAARSELSAALLKEPDHPFALLKLAEFAIKQNDFKAAHEFLARAVQSSASEAQAHELLAVLEYKEHARVDLLRLRLASRAGAPNWSIERRYVNALDGSGMVASAINELQSCLSTQWYRAESWQLLSGLLQKVGRPAEAKAALNTARDYDVRLVEHPSSL